MANLVGIMGESGSGKSTSIRSLDPKETFVINVEGKSLPFRGWKKKYSLISKDNPEGNMFSTDRVDTMLKILKQINTTLKHVKTIVIDDAQYVMSNEFMRRASEKGYEKFTEIGKNFYDILDFCKGLRSDLNVFILTHTETTDSGLTKFKTIGKMLDDKVTLEGKFTIVLKTSVVDGKYTFQTQTNGNDRVKSPMGMFDQQFIDNDLQLVIDAIKEYEEGE